MLSEKEALALAQVEYAENPDTAHSNYQLFYAHAINGHRERENNSPEAATKHYEAALGYINRTIELEPDSWWNHSQKAGILEDMGRYEEALESINNRINSPEGYTAAAFNGKGDILENLGRHDEARQAYIDGLETNGHKSDKIFHQQIAEQLGYDSPEEALNALRAEQEQLQNLDNEISIQPVTALASEL